MNIAVSRPRRQSSVFSYQSSEKDRRQSESLRLQRFTAYCLLCDSPSTADFLLESPLPGFENLVVWQRAVELSASIYCETRDLKDFGIRDQITRAGLLVPSNIAEGMERSTPADQCKFLDYARASCGEIRTQTIVGTKVGFLSQDLGQNWCHETRELAAMINGLINSISRRRP